MRLDIYLNENNILKSRELAKEAVKGGNVTVNGVIRTKPSFEVSDSDSVKFKGDSLKYVSRGGLKLESAVRRFKIDLNSKVCIDIGASTGGFTDCMLQKGAKLVYAVDAGHSQLHESLITDIRVINMEKTNIKDVSGVMLQNRIDFIAADVSFISLTHIIPKIKELLPWGKTAVVLIKPQFEAGRSGIGKKGIVKDPGIHLNVLQSIINFCGQTGLEVLDVYFSPVSGGDGNIEYLAYLYNNGKKSDVNNFPLQFLVSEAFKLLSNKKMKGV